MKQNKFKGQALNLIVVVEEVFNENKTKSGIDITNVVDANEKQKKGIVVSVGTECPKKSDGSQTIEVGWEIIFDKYKSTPMTQDGNPFILVDYRDIVWTGGKI